MPTLLRRRVHGQQQVVGGLFDSIAHAFKHITADIVGKLAPVVGPMFGLPPEAVAPLAALLIRAHAGSKDAKAKVEHLRTAGGTIKGKPVPASVLAPSLQRINVALHDHPHFGHMKQAAATAVQRAMDAKRATATP